MSASVLAILRLFLFLLADIRPTLAALLRSTHRHGSEDPGGLRADDITAFYINMPDRPARRTFAETQYRMLGIRAVRIEAISQPDGYLGNLFSWARAIDACIGLNLKSEHFCLIADDDAVFRPVNSTEMEALQDHQVPASEAANTTADAPKFYAGLTAAVKALPQGINGTWSGVHLCTLGESLTLPFAKRNSLVQGNPWPYERFSFHKIYPGAPDVLLLRIQAAEIYKHKLQEGIQRIQKSGDEILMDKLQSQMYSEEDNATAAGKNNTLKMFVVDNPQLCQHLPDITKDVQFRSSLGDGAASARR